MTARTGKFLATVLLGLAVSTSSLAAEPVTPKLTDKLSQAESRQQSPRIAQTIP